MRSAKLKPLITAWFLLLTSAVVSSQEPLDALFESLRTAASNDQARDIERKIWSIWHNPGDEELRALYRQGQSLIRSGRLGEARNLFSELIDKAPQFSEGWNQRATVLYYLNEYDASLADIEHALALEPRHYGAIFGKALIFTAHGQYEKALTALDEIERINPHAGGVASLRTQVESALQLEGV